MNATRPSPPHQRTRQRSAVKHYSFSIMAAILATIASPTPTTLARTSALEEPSRGVEASSDNQSSATLRYFVDKLGPEDPSAIQFATDWIIRASGATQTKVLSPGSFHGSGDGAFQMQDGYITGRASVATCLYAPVRLPQGATVASWLAWVLDQDAGQNATVRLLRQPLGGSAVVMANVASAGSSGAMQLRTDLTISQPVIDNTLYSYAAEVCLNTSGAAIQVHGVFFTYTEA